MAVELVHSQKKRPLIDQPKFPHFRHPCEALINMSLICVFAFCHLYLCMLEASSPGNPTRLKAECTNTFR